MRRFQTLLLVAGLAVILGILASHFWRPVHSEDVIYLAKNLYFETAGDSHQKARPASRALAELEAISHVTIGRQRVGRKGGFADTIRGVVCQPRQFSWANRTSKNPAGCKREPKDRKRYEFMLTLAQRHLKGEFTMSWPQSHACILWYKRADNKGVGKRPLRWFNAKTRPVATYGHHTFSCKRERLQKARQQKSGLFVCGLEPPIC